MNCKNSEKISQLKMKKSKKYLSKDIFISSDNLKKVKRSRKLGEGGGIGESPMKLGLGYQM